MTRQQRFDIRNARSALRDYIEFHRRIGPILPYMVVSDFRTTVERFNDVIDATNRRFSTSFVAGEPRSAFLEQVMDRVEMAHERDARHRQAQDRTTAVARPVAARQAWTAKAKQSLEVLGPLLSEAKETYFELRTTAV